MNKARPAVNLRRQSTSAGATKRITSAPSTLIVVNKGAGISNPGIERDPDVLRLQVNFINKHLVSVTVANCVIKSD